MTIAARPSEVLYRHLQTAFNTFMQELGISSNDAQRRVFSAAQQPWPTGKDVGTAQMEAQGKITDAWKEVDLPKRYQKALKDYKTAVERALAGVDVHVLDSQALMAVSQSFHHVAMYGFWLSDPAVLGTADHGPKPAETTPIEPDPNRKGSAPNPPAQGR